MTIDQPGDVYGNLSDGYTVGESVYRVQPLYLPVVIRSSQVHKVLYFRVFCNGQQHVELITNGRMARILIQISRNIFVK